MEMFLFTNLFYTEVFTYYMSFNYIADYGLYLFKSYKFIYLIIIFYLFNKFCLIHILVYIYTYL